MRHVHHVVELTPAVAANLGPALGAYGGGPGARARRPGTGELSPWGWGKT